MLQVQNKLSFYVIHLKYKSIGKYIPSYIALICSYQCKTKYVFLHILKYTLILFHCVFENYNIVYDYNKPNAKNENSQVL